MISDTLFEAAESIRTYQKLYREEYSNIEDRLNSLTAEMDAIRQLPGMDAPPSEIEVHIDTTDKKYAVTITDVLSYSTELGSLKPKICTINDETRVIGFSLPDGRVLRPQIGYEISDINDENHHDMSYQQLCDLGILSGDDISVTIHEIY